MTLDYKKGEVVVWEWGVGGLEGEMCREGCVSRFGRGLDFDSEGDGSDLDGLLC